MKNWHSSDEQFLEKTIMNRRNFLKVAGLTSLALFMRLGQSAGKLIEPQPQTAVSGKMYRGTSNGRIYTSADQGKTWNLHTDFGSQYSILGFYTKPGGQLYAHLSFQYRGFDIRLMKNEKYWSTVL